MIRFIEGVKNRKEARKKEPMAMVVCPVDGGYMAFDTVQEFIAWSKQK